MEVGSWFCAWRPGPFVASKCNGKPKTCYWSFKLLHSYMYLPTANGRRKWAWVWQKVLT